MAFVGTNGSVSRKTALSVLVGCLMMGVLIGLSPLSPIAGANNAKAEGRSTNLRDSAIPKNVVAPSEVSKKTVVDTAEDKSGLHWPSSRKTDEGAVRDGFAEGQGAWGPDDEEMEDWVDLWGGVDLVGAVNDADILADAESYTFSYDI